MRDLVGQRFSMWVVLEFAGKADATHKLWKCRCDCGHIKKVYEFSLRDGTSRSCGHGMAEAARKRLTTHGHSRSVTGRKSRTYATWTSMKYRCDNPRLREYPNYGGRGITYDDRWKDFFTFLDDMGERPEGMTLDRIDNNLGYSKENCRWATKKQQQWNRRKTIQVPDGGETVSLAEYARRKRIDPRTAKKRLLAKNIIQTGE